MTDLNEVLNLVPVGDIAKKLGIPDDVAEAAVKQVLPGLVGGLAANASTTSGSASLEKALTKHVDASTDVDSIDTADGAKIVSNIFGSNQDAVASKLAAAEPKPNVTSDIIKQILPIVAPIVLSFIASQVLKPKSGGAHDLDGDQPGRAGLRIRVRRGHRPRRAARRAALGPERAERRRRPAGRTAGGREKIGPSAVVWTRCCRDRSGPD